MIRRLLDVSSTDPDDARRRKLLNILLAGVVPLTILTLLVTVVTDITGLDPHAQFAILYLGCFALLFGLAITFLINRYWSGVLASSLFLLLINAVVPLVDEPREVAAGRSLLLLAVPIIMSSVLLRPYASFLMAGLNSLLIAFLALNLQLVPSPYAMLVFFVIALVSWLSARTLERALRDLRLLNQELDQRVRDRTRELAEALSRNQAVLEGIADGVIVLDNDGKAVVANPAIADLLARPADEIIGRDIQVLMGGEMDAQTQATIANLLKDRETHPSDRFEWGQRTLSVSVAPVRDDLNYIVGTVSVWRDFTREAEVERMKSAFVSMVSHELRTPLTAVLGFSEMLYEAVYGPLSDVQQGVLKRIMVNGRVLLDLVNNLMDQAQLETGILKLRIAPFTLADLIGDVMNTMEGLAQAKNLKLTSHIAEDVPARLSGDQQRLRQILINLVSNAIKFTDRGTVKVRVYRPDAAHWALEVSDTGRGIPADAQAYVFDRFRQVDDPATRTQVGAGLGLSIVKQMAALMGGEVALKSEVGKGSTFTVVLPLVPSA
jgi:PAS domain S-box-containing protein